MQTRTKTKKVKIGDLFSSLGIDPYPNVNYLPEFDLKVKTPYGFKSVLTLFTTEKQKPVTTEFANGVQLTTSGHHLFKTENRDWVKANELTAQDLVITEEGTTTLAGRVQHTKEEVMYDLSVQDVFCYYSDGVLSHNSWTLVALGGIAAQLGYNVIHYTLELSEDYVGRRYDAFFTGIPVAHIMSHRQEVEQILEQVPGKIIIKEFATGRASINTVENHIRKCIDNDFKPDLIIIDYVDLLSAKKKSKERKDEIDDIYLNTKGLARELKLPIWSVSQVNRSGAKDDIIEGDKAAGSYDKIMITDFAMSLSRKRQDKVNGTGRFHIMKNRYGGDGMTFAAKIDTTTGRIDIETEELTEEDMDMMAQASKPDRAGFDSYDKKLLAKKFFELSKQ